MKRKGGGKVTPEVIEEMKKLRKEGLSYGKIADKLKLSTMTVYNYLKKEEKVGFFERLRRKIKLITVLIVAVGIACVGYYLLTSEGEPSEIEFKTYINENYSFKFDYPVDWILEEWSLPWVGSPISQFLVRENVSENERGGFINLIVKETDISLEDLLENFIIWVEGENFTVISGPSNIAIDGVLAVKYLIKSIPIGNTRIQIKLMYIFAKKDNYLYTFQLLAKEEKYHDYEPIFEHMIDSFSFQT